jgi:hypothetical protein
MLLINTLKITLKFNHEPPFFGPKPLPLLGYKFQQKKTRLYTHIIWAKLWDYRLEAYSIGKC